LLLAFSSALLLAFGDIANGYNTVIIHFLVGFGGGINNLAADRLCVRIGYLL
jgi:hypothetical protein